MNRIHNIVRKSETREQHGRSKDESKATNAPHTLDHKLRGDMDPIAVQYCLGRQRPLLPGVFFCAFVTYDGLQLVLVLELAPPAAPGRWGTLLSLGFDGRQFVGGWRSGVDIFVIHIAAPRSLFPAKTAGSSPQDVTDWRTYLHPWIGAPTEINDSGVMFSHIPAGTLSIPVSPLGRRVEVVKKSSSQGESRSGAVKCALDSRSIL